MKNIYSVYCYEKRCVIFKCSNKLCHLFEKCVISIMSLCQQKVPEVAKCHLVNKKCQKWVSLRSEILFVHLLCILFLIFKNRLKWHVRGMILWLCYLWHLSSYALLNKKDIRKKKFLFIVSSISTSVNAMGKKS